MSGASIAALLGYTRARGAPIDDALAEVGLDAEGLAMPERRVEVVANNHLWARAAAALKDVDFGLHFAEGADIDAFHLVGHLATTSATLGQALDRIVAYSRLLHDAGRTEVEREGDRVLLYPGCRGLPEAPPRHVAEFTAASVVLLGRLITREAWSPVEVRFQHAAPERVREHVRVLGVTPRFGAPETVVILDARLMSLPVRATQSKMGSYLEAYARELIARLPAGAGDLRDKVLRAIAVGVARGAAEIGAVAAQLGMTPRTLQRRLADEGTTFAALSDEVRCQCAERYLGDGQLPISEIAFLLGFTDPSNFHKAFRRWTGTTPGAFRARTAAA